GGFLATLGLGLLMSAALGYLLEWVFFSALYGREHLQQVLLTYALILIFDGLRSILAGDDVHAVATPAWLSGALPLGSVMTYPAFRLFISAIGVVVALALYLVLTRTRLGMAVRAAASNREMVQSLGVDVARLYRAVFAGGVALAALAGMIAAPVSSVHPGLGG